jgi:hypothetical protein
MLLESFGLFEVLSTLSPVADVWLTRTLKPYLSGFILHASSLAHLPSPATEALVSDWPTTRTEIQSLAARILVSVTFDFVATRAICDIFEFPSSTNPPPTPTKCLPPSTARSSALTSSGRLPVCDHRFLLGCLEELGGWRVWGKERHRWAQEEGVFEWSGTANRLLDPRWTV